MNIIQIVHNENVKIIPIRDKPHQILLFCIVLHMAHIRILLHHRPAGLSLNKQRKDVLLYLDCTIHISNLPISVSVGSNPQRFVVGNLRKVKDSILKRVDNDATCSKLPQQFHTRSGILADVIEVFRYQGTVLVAIH